MNLIQKIVKKAKEKIDELLLIRKVKNEIKSMIILREESINRSKDAILNCLECGDVTRAFMYYKEMQNTKKGIKELEEFKSFVLDNEKNEN